MWPPHWPPQTAAARNAPACIPQNCQLLTIYIITLHKVFDRYIMSKACLKDVQKMTLTSTQNLFLVVSCSSITSLHLWCRTWCRQESTPPNIRHFLPRFKLHFYIICNYSYGRRLIGLAISAYRVDMWHVPPCWCTFSEQNLQVTSLPTWEQCRVSISVRYQTVVRITSICSHKTVERAGI